jgi:hypothetical protein
MTGMSYPAREGTTRNDGAPESRTFGRFLSGLIDQGGGEGRSESTAEEGMVQPRLAAAGDSSMIPVTLAVMRLTEA